MFFFRCAFRKLFLGGLPRRHDEKGKLGMHGIFQGAFGGRFARLVVVISLLFGAKDAKDEAESLSYDEL